MLESNRKSHIGIILIFMYLILAIIVTAVSIWFHNKNEIEYILGEKQSSQVSNLNVMENNNTVLNNNTSTNKITSSSADTIKNSEKIKLTDKFKVNNLKIEEVEYNYGDMYRENDRYLNKFRITYIQISGLKNKELENRINAELKEKALKEEKEYNECKNVWVSSTCHGNFANVLSVSIYKCIYNEENTDDITYTDVINIKLDTGEHISFEELFTPDSSLKSIVTKCTYNYFYEEIGREAEINGESKADYSVIENKVSKVMKDINNTEELKFVFNERYIYLYPNYIIIPMIDFYQSINVYNLVNPEESLYENGDVENSIYVFGLDFSKGIEFKDKISKYIYLNMFNYYKTDDYSYEGENSMTEKTSRAYNENIDKIKDCIIEYEKSLNTNKGAFYNIYSYNENEDNIEFWVERIILEKKNFEDNVEEVYRTMSQADKTSKELNMTLYTIRDSDEIDDFKILENDDGKFEVKHSEY